MLSLWRELKRWFHDWFDPPYKTIFIKENTPESLSKRTLYIVTEDGCPWHAEMICPCGCGETLHLNLLTDDRPVWHIQTHKDGTISLKPSVWRQAGCHSHFWFQKGRVLWCNQ